MPLPQLGLGLGWRPEIAGLFADLPGLRFCEVIAESLTDRTLLPALTTLRETGVAVIPHGVTLSLGGAEPVTPKRVAHLAACAARLDAPLVSEHIAFVRASGMEAGHLLPVPRSREALDVLVRNVQQLQDHLPVPVALEPIAALFDWPDDEFSEPDFLIELRSRTGAWLLLDVANVYANAVNRGTDPAALLMRLPLERVAYIHVAGGVQHNGLYHDTHTHATPPPVLELLAQLCTQHPPRAIMLERDGCYPPADRLRAELDIIAAAAALPPDHQMTDPSPTTSTGDLATRQAALIAALVAGGPLPAGFDHARVSATRRALSIKRAREVATVWPRLAASLGANWTRRFTTWANARPPLGPLRDGWDFARALTDAGELPERAAAELAQREATWHYDGRCAPRRHRLRAVRQAATRTWALIHQSRHNRPSQIKNNP